MLVTMKICCVVVLFYIILSARVKAEYINRAALQAYGRENYSSAEGTHCMTYSIRGTVESHLSRVDIDAVEYLYDGYVGTVFFQSPRRSFNSNLDELKPLLSTHYYDIMQEELQVCVSYPDNAPLVRGDSYIDATSCYYGELSDYTFSNGYCVGGHLINSNFAANGTYVGGTCEVVPIAIGGDITYTPSEPPGPPRAVDITSENQAIICDGGEFFPGNYNLGSFAANVCQEYYSVESATLPDSVVSKGSYKYTVCMNGNMLSLVSSGRTLLPSMQSGSYRSTSCSPQLKAQQHEIQDNMWVETVYNVSCTGGEFNLSSVTTNPNPEGDSEFDWIAFSTPPYGSHTFSAVFTSFGCQTFYSIFPDYHAVVILSLNHKFLSGHRDAIWVDKFTGHNVVVCWEDYHTEGEHEAVTITGWVISQKKGLEMLNASPTNLNPPDNTNVHYYPISGLDYIAGTVEINWSSNKTHRGICSEVSFEKPFSSVPYVFATVAIETDGVAIFSWVERASETGIQICAMISAWEINNLMSKPLQFYYVAVTNMETKKQAINEQVVNAMLEFIDISTSNVLDHNLWYTTSDYYEDICNYLNGLLDEEFAILNSIIQVEDPDKSDGMHTNRAIGNIKIEFDVFTSDPAKIAKKLIGPRELSSSDRAFYNEYQVSFEYQPYVEASYPCVLGPWEAGKCSESSYSATGGVQTMVRRVLTQPYGVYAQYSCAEVEATYRCMVGNDINHNTAYPVEIIFGTAKVTEIYESNGLSGGAIAGIVIGCLVFLAAVGGGIYYYKHITDLKQQKLKSYGAMPRSIGKSEDSSSPDIEEPNATKDAVDYNAEEGLNVEYSL